MQQAVVKKTAEIDLGELTGPVLVFGGPYSNLAATEALQKVAQKRHIATENILCSGDVVAYCAEPQATVDRIRDWRIPVLMGNCEESLATGADDCGCGFAEDTLCSVLSRGWYAYANRLINDSCREWMAALPRRIRFSLAGRHFAVIHGSVRQISQFIFPSTSTGAKVAEIESIDADVILAGHSGLPFGQCFGARAWLNAGVIGLPANDGTPDGWYLLLQTEETQLTASWHRLVYNAELSSLNMTTAGLHEYAQALLSGHWPSMDVLPVVERQKQGIRLDPPELLLPSDSLLPGSLPATAATT